MQLSWVSNQSVYPENRTKQDKVSCSPVNKIPLQSQINRIVTSHFKILNPKGKAPCPDKISDFLTKGRPYTSAALHGNIRLINCLLNNGINPHELNEMGDNPLHTICKSVFETAISNRSEVIKTLYKAGVDAMQANKRGQRPIEWMMPDLNDEEILKELGKFLPGQPKEVSTILHKADSENVINFLLRNGVSVDALDSSNATPLERALERSNLVVARILINKKAKLPTYLPGKKIAAKTEINYINTLSTFLNVYMVDKEGKSILRHACETYTLVEKKPCKLHEKFIQDLIQRNFSLTLKSNDGYSPLDIIVRNNLLSDYQILDILTKLSPQEIKMAAEVLHHTTSPKIIDFLIDNKISIDSFDRQNKTALSWALKNANTDLVNHFSKRGANINIELPLKDLAFGKDIYFIKHIKNLGIDVFQIDSNGDNLLMHACELKCLKSSEVDYCLAEFILGLIDLRFDPCQENRFGISPLFLIIKENLLSEKNIIKILKSLTDSKLETASTAIPYVHHYSIMNFFYQKGFSLDRFDKTGNTALFFAVERLDEDFIKFLITRKANPDLQKPDLTGSKYRNILTPRALLVFKTKEILGLILQLEEPDARPVKVRGISAIPLPPSFSYRSLFNSKGVLVPKNVRKEQLLILLKTTAEIKALFDEEADLGESTIDENQDTQSSSIEKTASISSESQEDELPSHLKTIIYPDIVMIQEVHNQYTKKS